MERVNRVWNHPVFQEHYQNLQLAEKDRIFCRHGLEHLLDVARLMHIRNMEEAAGMDKEIIYSAAFLHDIGRFMQISEGIPHHKAGAEIAEKILRQCGYSETDVALITSAIEEHRDGSDSLLGRYLYDADKKSRCCFACNAQDECKWSDEKKNMEIKV